MNVIQEKLRFYRESSHLSPKQVGMILAATSEEYASFENGSKDITAAQLLTLCEFYGLKIDDITNSSESKAPSAVDQPKVLTLGVNGVYWPISGRAVKISKSRASKKNRSENQLPGGHDVRHLEIPDNEQRFLTLISRILVEVTMKQIEDKARLKTSPNGFHYAQKKNCVVCDKVVSGEQSWFDRNGVKCMCCQKAIEQQIIPYWVTKSRNSFYTEGQLELNFGLKGRVLNHWKRTGIVRSRIIPKVEGNSAKHFEIFLRSENRDFLPPHKLLKTGAPVKELNNGIEEFVFYPWYCFVDPVDHLKDYGISRYLRFDERKEDRVQGH